MIAAYFGGLAADRRTSYELVLEQQGPQYRVLAFTRQGGQVRRPREADSGRGLWGWLGPRPTALLTKQLYSGRDSRRALMALFRNARAANLAELGQRFCYVMPSTPRSPGALAALIPQQLRYDGSLPLHPQLWQTGRALDTLPLQLHPAACTDMRAFGDERKPLALPPERRRA